jgi:hypothetical protein
MGAGMTAHAPIGPRAFARRSHIRAGTALVNSLTLGDEAAWAGFTVIVMARLSDRERAALAYAALMALDDWQAFLVSEAALWGVVREGGRND